MFRLMSPLTLKKNILPLAVQPPQLRLLLTIFDLLFQSFLDVSLCFVLTDLLLL